MFGIRRLLHWFIGWFGCIVNVLGWIRAFVLAYASGFGKNTSFDRRCIVLGYVAVTLDDLCHRDPSYNWNTPASGSTAAAPTQIIEIARMSLIVN